jgi:hypothetical protein
MNFQYICTFNSDKLPTSEFSPGFNIDAFTRMRFTDETEDGGLLGIRLPSAATRAPKSSSRGLENATAQLFSAIEGPASSVEEDEKTQDEESAQPPSNQSSTQSKLTQRNN